MNDRLLAKIVNSQPYPLLFATISGAYLYGFPSPDSDYDLRGSHILPTKEVVGLNPIQETIEVSKLEDNLELDLVTHDVKKFFALLLKRNGYVLEQLYSPLIVHTTPEHQELKAMQRGLGGFPLERLHQDAIATKCITRHHSHHYLGFSRTQWRLFEKGNPPKVKPLLYVYRVLLTGIHLMQTGIIEANLVKLNEKFQLSYLDELIAKKTTGVEKSTLKDTQIDFYLQEYERLQQELKIASHHSHLPENSSAKPELNDLLVRVRLKLIANS